MSVSRCILSIISLIQLRLPESEAFSIHRSGNVWKKHDTSLHWPTQLPQPSNRDGWLMVESPRHVLLLAQGEDNIGIDSGGSNSSSSDMNVDIDGIGNGGSINNKSIINEVEETMVDDNDVDVDALLKRQQQDLEVRYTVELTRLKLTLATVKEEMTEMKIRAREYEASSQNLEKQLQTEMEEKTKQLDQLEQQWKQKYQKKVDDSLQETSTLKQESDSERATLEGAMNELRREITTSQNQSDQLQQSYQTLEQRLEQEMELKKIQLLELEQTLTEQFEIERTELREWGQNNEDMLEETQDKSKRELEELQTKNEEEQKQLRKEISKLTDELGLVSRQLKNSRNYHGSLRRETNKVKQNVLFQQRKERKQFKFEIAELTTMFTEQIESLKDAGMAEVARLTEERDTARTQLSIESSQREQLQIDIEQLQYDMTTQIQQLKDEASKNITNTERIWSSKLSVAISKAQREKASILKERDETVAKKDSQIEGYEEELSSLRCLAKRTAQIVKSRTRYRYDTLKDSKVGGKLHRTGKKIADLTKRALVTESGTSRLAFVTDKTARAARRMRNKDE